MQVSAQEIREVIASSKVISDLSEVKDDTNLYEIGIDSLDIFTLYLKIEEHFDVKIPDDDVDDLNTINALALYIESNRK